MGVWGSLFSFGRGDFERCFAFIAGIFECNNVLSTSTVKYAIYSLYVAAELYSEGEASQRQDKMEHVRVQVQVGRRYAWRARSIGERLGPAINPALATCTDFLFWRQRATCIGEDSPCAQLYPIEAGVGDTMKANFKASLDVLYQNHC